MVFSGVSGLMAGKSMQGIPAPMVPTLSILWNSGIFQMIKVTEVISGLMLVIGFWPALAAIFIAPISVGVIIFNAMLTPAYLPMGVVLCIFNAYFGYVYFDKYRALFTK